MPKKDGSVMVRSATIDDVDAIAEMVEMFVKSGDLLPRSRAEIMMTVGDWVIASLNDKPVGIPIAFKHLGQATTRQIAATEGFF